MVAVPAGEFAGVAAQALVCRVRGCAPLRLLLPLSQARMLVSWLEV